ncbi:MAG: hypothetical protein IKX85_06980, partial [Clostridia bacterium]|nr:hypothetical protein [Clostridia bacterium]
MRAFRKKTARPAALLLILLALPALFAGCGEGDGLALRSSYAENAMSVQALPVVRAADACRVTSVEVTLQGLR